MSQYLVFREVGDTGKTKLISVDSRWGGRLATIRWYGSWRQYVLSPEPNTVWNVGCLRDVESYIEGLMAERSNRQDDRRRDVLIPSSERPAR